MNKNFKKILMIVGVSAGTTLGCLYGFSKYHEYQYAGTQSTTSLPFNYASFKGDNPAPGQIDFTAAAEAATPAVVHIKVKINAKKSPQGSRQGNPFGDLFGDPFGDFFGGPQQAPRAQQASGSGVLISADGYIVTNNHVVDKADEIKVTLANKKSYTAKLIGKDANSDLAVLKIDGNNFPYITYGNSDNLKLGQWVLAIGYPLNLDVTVTAGIISAKSRSTGLTNGQAPIDSYIQTDAAINPGNSGGALVNTEGQLIGINSQIASPTGSYAGYAYAIPVNIVKKTITDLIKYGAVQRGYLGLEYLNAPLDDEDVRKKFGIKGDVDGVYVSGVQNDGAAKEAGVLKGDIITKIDGQKVSGPAELTAIIAGHKPGDKVPVTILRNGTEKTINITLKNSVGTIAATTPQTAIEQLGGELSTLDATTARQNNVRGGVIVKKIGKGLLSKTRMQEGFIIISANDVNILKVEDLKKVLVAANGGTVQIKGFYPNDNYLHGYIINLGDGGDSSSNGGDMDDDN